MRYFLFFIFFGLASNSIHARERTQNQNEYWSCFNSAAAYYQIDDVNLLIAIAKHESGLNPRAIGKPNSDGSVDYGLMQINSRHLPMLERAGITKEDLFNPCTNIFVGAHILSGFFKKHGKTWRAVGAYNAGSATDRENTRRIYVQKIRELYFKSAPSREDV